MELILKTDLEPITIKPAKVSNLRELRSSLVKLQSYWIEKTFSTADVLIEHEQLFKDVFQCLSVNSVLYDRLILSYPEYEQIFFCDHPKPEELHGWNVEKLAENFAVWPGCWLTRAHLFNPRKLLEEANELWWGRLTDG